MNRRTFMTATAAAVAAGFLSQPGPVAAAGLAPYEAGSFQSAIKSGPVIVHVHADWCPVCRKQQPALEQLSNDPSMAKVRFVTVNFDRDKAFLRSNKVANQSVILIYKNGKEVGRLIGTTNADQIRAGVVKALA